MTQQHTSMRASKLDKNDETQKMTMKTGYFSEIKWACEREQNAIQKCCLRIQNLSSASWPYQITEISTRWIAVALLLLQSTCPCILHYIRTSSFTITIYISRAIIIMVNREIKGTIAKLKERNSIPLCIVTADGSVHLFGIFSEICRHKSLCSHRLRDLYAIM